MVTLTEDELRAKLGTAFKEGCRIGAQEGIQAYEAEKKKVNELNRSTCIKGFLTKYRREKKMIRGMDLSEFKLSAEEKAEERFNFLKDLMNPETFVCRTEERLIDKEIKRKRLQYRVVCIEKAIELYRAECESTSEPEALRRFRIMYGYYIDEPKISMECLADNEAITLRTAYRDLNIATSDLADYLLGIL